MVLMRLLVRLGNTTKEMYKQCGPVPYSPVAVALRYTGQSSLVLCQVQ
jgi:hypothetical protein